LNRRGIKRVRPLAGGFNEWRERGYPVEKVETAVVAGGDTV
jgi:3-mercaptopyruvate sulfurtransferase SseA